MDVVNDDVGRVGRIDVVPTILEVVCRTTGLGFAAVARVTADRWIACAVRDEIAFGLEPGGELPIETTICNEIRQNGVRVVIDSVADDARYCRHPTARRYGFQSYISVPIVQKDGRFFGTLCAIDPRPARLSAAHVVGMFTLFADLIACHLDAAQRVAALETAVDERTRALHEAHAALQQRTVESEADRDQLRSLAARVERLREDERAAVARELHDEFGQALTALRLDLSAARRLMPDAAVSALVLPLLQRMDTTVDEALDSIERIVGELRPAILDDLGCGAAAEWLLARFEQRTGVRTSCDVDRTLVLPDAEATAVFRILQEALTNIARHAAATAAHVELCASGGEVRLQVTDDGRGIAAAEAVRPLGYGLRGMSERLRSLNGSLTLDRPATGGTCLLARFPLDGRCHGTR